MLDPSCKWQLPLDRALVVEVDIGIRPQPLGDAHEPASDVENRAAVDGLKALDPIGRLQKRTSAESLTKVFREMVQQHREYHTDPAPRSSKRTSNK
jgi:hypothetical protein